MKTKQILMLIFMVCISNPLWAIGARLTEQQKKVVTRELRSAITKILESINNEDANQPDQALAESSDQIALLHKLNVQVNEINNCCKEGQAELIAAILLGVRAILQESGILDALMQISAQLVAQQEQLNMLQAAQNTTNTTLGSVTDQAGDVDMLLTLPEINAAQMSVEEWLKTIYYKLTLISPIS